MECSEMFTETICFPPNYQILYNINNDFLWLQYLFEIKERIQSGVIQKTNGDFRHNLFIYI